VPQAAAHRGRVSFCDRVRTCRRWDCINVRQRERAKEARFAACTSLLTSPATRRMPPKCGAFPVQSRRSPLRQTGRWSKADSNPWSHFRAAPCAEPYRPALTLRKPEDETRKPGRASSSCGPGFESFRPLPARCRRLSRLHSICLVNRCGGRCSQEIDQCLRRGPAARRQLENRPCTPSPGFANRLAVGRQYRCQRPPSAR
jgi:hypothetical protein